MSCLALIFARTRELVFVLCCVSTINTSAQVFERFLGATSGVDVSAPSAIAISSDRVYVIDAPTSTVKVYSKDGTSLFQFGGVGSEDQKFAGPSAIAVDTQGNVFIADGAQFVIKKFDRNGTFITKWGRFGTDKLGFLQPNALAIHSTTGDVFVGDQGNFKIARYSNNGKYILSFGGYTTGGDDDKFSAVKAITVDVDGNVYVAENNTVKIFNGNTGKFIKKVVTTLPSQSFGNQSGIAVDASKDLYLTDSFNGGLIKKIVNPLSTPSVGTLNITSLYDPKAIALDVNGELYVVDRLNVNTRDFNQPTILRIQQSGTIIKSWGKVPPDQPTVFTSPAGIAANKDGLLFVTDVSGDKIHVFNADGTYSSSFGSSGLSVGNFSAPIDIVIDQVNGDLYILEISGQRVQVFNSARVFQRVISSAGTADGFLSNPQGITFDKNGLIVVCDQVNRRIQRFTRAGAFVDKAGSAGSGDGQFSKPADAAVDSKGNIFVVDPENKRVSKFSSTLAFLSKWGTAGDKDGEFLYPISIAVSSDDHIFVLDQSSHKVQEFDNNGNWLQTFGSSNVIDFNAIRFPAGIALVGNNIYVSDATGRSVLKFNRILVSDFSPKSGLPGTLVTVTGIGIDPAPTFMSAKVGNTSVAIQSATGSQFQFTIPENATSGKVSFFKSGVQTASRQDFAVLPVALSRFSPPATMVGDTVTIYGTGFSVALDGNRVQFGALNAQVISAARDQIKVLVPNNVVKSKISVTVSDVQVVSASEFTPTALGVVSASLPGYFQSGSTSLTANVKVNTIGILKNLSVKWKGITNAQNTFQTAQATTTTDGNNLTIVIPKESFSDPIGTKLFFELQDLNDTKIASDTVYTYQFFSKAAMPAIPNLKFGKRPTDFQLVSVPYTLTTGTVGSVLADLGLPDPKKWRLFGYTGAEVGEITGSGAPFAQGTSYWLIVRESIDIKPGEGHSSLVTEQRPFTLNLKLGWNMIGNPYNFPLSWNNVLAKNGNPSGLGTLRFYQDGTYSTSDVLKPYQGAFVNNTTGDTLSIKIPVTNTSGSGRTMAPQQSSMDPTNWFVSLKVGDGILSNELIGFGMNPEAKVGRDRFDETPLPTPDGLNTFSFLIRKQLHRDYVSTAREYSWTATVSSVHDLSLEWDQRYIGTSDQELFIELEGHPALVNMKNSSQLTIPPGKHTIHFHFGNSIYIAQASKSDQWMLGDPSPNPLPWGAASISFAVNVPSTSTELGFTLVDATGKLYAFHDRSLPDGRSLQEFELPTLAPGLYFIRMDLVSSQQTKRYTKKLLVR